VSEEATDSPAGAAAIDNLAAALKVKANAERYYCQSTELAAATESFPGIHVLWMFWIALREIWVGNRSLSEVAGLIWHGIKILIRKRRHGDALLRHIGPNKRTPVQCLGLRPGEIVRIRSEEEIVATLDSKSRNRGLGITTAMTRSCGQTHAVRTRFDKMISEATGRMHEIENTVTLEGCECYCYFMFGGCPRRDLLYWREIWLERTTDSAEKKQV
jgi:hypothetical protein